MANEIDEGGKFNPYVPGEKVSGISRRDWLAGLAMQSLILRGEFDSVHTNYVCPSCEWPSLVILDGVCPRCHHEVTKKEYDACQKREEVFNRIAYRIADATIKTSKEK